MTMPVNLNIVSASESQTSRIGFFLAWTMLRARAKMMLKTTTWRISPSAAAWTKLWGKMWTRTSANFCGLAAMALMSPAVRIDPDAGLDEVDEGQAQEQGDRRHDLEIDEGLDPHPADGLQVAVAGDADDEGGEDERGDDRLDEADEDDAQRPEGFTGLGKERSDEESEPHADEDVQRQAALFGAHAGLK